MIMDSSHIASSTSTIFNLASNSSTADLARNDNKLCVWATTSTWWSLRLLLKKIKHKKTPCRPHTHCCGRLHTRHRGWLHSTRLGGGLLSWFRFRSLWIRGRLACRWGWGLLESFALLPLVVGGGRSSRCRNTTSTTNSSALMLGGNNSLKDVIQRSLHWRSTRRALLLLLEKKKSDLILRPTLVVVGVDQHAQGAGEDSCYYDTGEWLNIYHLACRHGEAMSSWVVVLLKRITSRRIESREINFVWGAAG